MSTTTNKLKLFKYDPVADANNTFNITNALNNNFDKIESKTGLLIYDNTATYSQNDWVLGTVDSQQKIFKSLANSNTGNALTDTTKWQEIIIGGSWGNITGTLSNQTDLGTALSNKADKDFSNCTKPYIKTTYKSGSSWYRIYSDGWCEMGGETTTRDEEVTFPKTFADTTYNVVGNEIVNSTADESELLIFKLSTNKIRVYCDYGGSQFGGVGACWRASGKLANGQY